MQKPKADTKRANTAETRGIEHMRIIANRNTNDGSNDRFGANLKKDCKGRDIDIAVAFFTDNNALKSIADEGSSVRLIVRLNLGTRPDALEKIIHDDRIKIRWFSSTAFHPKLYIIKHICAYVGSSNLTQSALAKNNEINVRLDYEQDSEAYEELSTLFEQYWEEAVPLDIKTLIEFKSRYSKIEQAQHLPDWYSKVGETKFSNSNNLNRKDKKIEFINTFKQAYHDYIAAFRKLESFYMRTPERKFPDIPLRIETDRFLWWLREEKCQGDSWINPDEYPDEDIAATVVACKKEFIAPGKYDKYLESIAHNYEVVAKAFASRETIMAMNEDEMFNALDNVHSFHDLLRFHQGGIEGVKRDFYDANTLDEIKRTLCHLLFDESEDYEERIYDCIYTDGYKLGCFGESCVKEIYGYNNPDDIPICNGRTLKSMEWLGLGRF